MITNTMVHQGKISNFENFIMSISYRHSKKLQDFAEGVRGFNIRHTRLYASSKAPRLHIWMLHKHIIKTH